MVDTLPRAPTANEPAPAVGRYELREKVGAGGMGVVYRAYDPQLHRDVAIKLVYGGGTKRRSRLLREARAMAQVAHPNVVRVYDVGPLGEGMFIAMELIDGLNARAWLRRERPGWRRIVGVFRAAGRGLAAAHAAGLVHRDFKPANVVVGDDGRVRVLDFGLARPSDERAHPAPQPEDTLDPLDPLAAPITASGAVLGTPIYMAPEQHAGELADARSDQFAYCVALYEALWGRPPFEGPTIEALARAKVERGPNPPPAIPSGSTAAAATDERPGASGSSHTWEPALGVPPGMWPALRRGLAVDPADRYPGMPELLRTLRELQGEAPGGRRAWIGAGVALAAAGVLAVALAVRDDCRSQRTDAVAAALGEEPPAIALATLDVLPACTSGILTRAEALAVAGDLAAAGAEARAVLDAGDPAAAGQAWRIVAAARLAEGGSSAPDDAKAALREAYFAAVAVASPEIAAAAAIDLVGLLAQADRHDEAQDWARHARGQLLAAPSVIAAARLDLGLGDRDAAHAALAQALGAEHAFATGGFWVAGGFRL